VIQRPSNAFEAGRLRLARLAVDETQSLERVFARSTRLIARTLDVERVGIWLFEDRGARLRCACLYHRSTDRHEAGGELSLAGLPRYRLALEEHRGIVAHDARGDPRTSELAADYLVPHGIVSMLDAPLFQHGEVVGVVCHEHIGAPRRWTEAEIAFAESVADLVALTMEQAAHIEARRSLDELSRRAELDRRMAALGRVAAGVAHDFGSLLMVVQARAGQIASHDGVPPQAREWANGILETVCRGRDLIRQLAEIGQRGDPDPNAPPIDEMVGATAGLLESLATEGRRVELILDAPGARVRLDRSAMERIVVNLVSNALHASPPGGLVRVATAAVHGVDGRYAILRVVDHGHGMDDDTRPLIFEPYFTTRRGSGGCGLGLATVHALVHGADGFIDVDSEPEHGTTVAIHLPVVR
jgi:two-component system cell cycle sensor histidine kinase/response regulator CckA